MSKIIFHLNTLSTGGTERVVTNLANGLCDTEEVIVATEWQEKNEFKLDKRVKRINAGLTAEDEKKTRFIQILKRDQYLRRLIKKENPDIVIAFGHKANYRALVSASGLKVPVVVCVRIDPVGNYDGKADRLLLPLLYKRASGAVFQTEQQGDYFKPYLKCDTKVIINPINEKYFNVVHPSDKTKTVVQHARLVDFKNQALLIDAFMKVHEKYPDYDLKIYGPDSYDGTKELLNGKIGEYNAEGFIHLMGGCDEIEKEVPKAMIYVTSSDYEGMPNSLMEAMAMGMPVISTDCPCGGPKALIRDRENGMLVPIKDSDAMAEAIIYMIEHPDFARSCGQNASKIKEIANTSYIVNEWHKYITNVIGSFAESR